MKARPAQSRLLLRLASAIAESKIPISLLRGRRDGRWTEDGERTGGMPEAGWSRIETFTSRLAGELAYADSCLDEDPTSSEVETLLAASSETRRAAILQRYVDRAYSLRLHDARQGLAISDNLLAWTENPTPLVAVVRCRALMERGNFLRILDDREGAYRALAEASRELEAHGITDPLEWARHAELLGTLEGYCGNIGSARRLLEKALSKARRWGTPYTRQRILIAAGLLELHCDNYHRGQLFLEEAMATEEPDPLFLRYAAANRVLGYLASGNPPLAYQAVCGLHARFGKSWLQRFPIHLQMRHTWVEGQIRNALGMDEEAIGLLEKAREFYLRTDGGFLISYLSLDLAMAYAARRRFAEVRRELSFTLPFCTGETNADRFGKEALELLLRRLQREGRLEIEHIRAVLSRLEYIRRAPLRSFAQSPLAGL